MRLLLFFAFACLLQGCATQSGLALAEKAAGAKCELKKPRTTEGTYSLALSGGGYRAMLFHAGAIWRLHELGILDEVRVVSSVSGGSITAGVLAAEYERVRNDAPNRSDCYRALVASPLLQLAQTTIDWKAAVISLAIPASPGNVLSSIYERRLFGATLLSDLPLRPKFLFQATNLHTGSVWTFSRTSIGDTQIGSAAPGALLIASAVAASSAFPPVLSPFRLKASAFSWNDSQIDPSVMNSREYVARATSQTSGIQAASADINSIRSLRESSIFLTDGGVSDNLGLEGIWHGQDTLLVSDGGSEAKANMTPPTAWIGQLAYITELIHTQPTQLRYRLLIDGFRKEQMNGRDGSYWAISKPFPSHKEKCYQFTTKASEPLRKILAAIPTRLATLSEIEAKQLVNLGYHSADWHIPYLNKRMERENHSISIELPYPEAPLWPNIDKDRLSKAC